MTVINKLPLKASINIDDTTIKKDTNNNLSAVGLRKQDNTIIMADDIQSGSFTPRFVSQVYIDMSKASSLAGVFTLPIVSSSNFSVDWGDGSAIDKYETATTSITHTYADSSFIGWVNFYDNWGGFELTQTGEGVDDSKLCVIKIYYSNYIASLAWYAFSGMENLNNFEFNNNSLNFGRPFGFNYYLEDINLPENYTGVFGSYSMNPFFTHFSFPKHYSYAISDHTFGSNSQLIDLKMPYNYYTIDDNGLSAISNLKYLNLRNCGSIGSYGLGWCYGLRTLQIESLIPPTLGTDVFISCNNLKEILVPYQSLNAYKTASGWSAYADIIFPITNHGVVNIFNGTYTSSFYEFTEGEFFDLGYKYSYTITLSSGLTLINNSKYRIILKDSSGNILNSLSEIYFGNYGTSEATPTINGQSIIYTSANDVSYVANAMYGLFFDNVDDSGTHQSGFFIITNSNIPTSAMGALIEIDLIND